MAGRKHPRTVARSLAPAALVHAGWLGLLATPACSGLAAPEEGSAILEAEAPVAEAQIAEAQIAEPLRGGEPLTVSLPLSAELRRAIAALGTGSVQAEPTLSLAIEGVRAPRAEAGIRVFVGHPGATAATALDDPRYVGSFTFFPEPSGAEAEEPSTFLLDLGPSLRRLAPAERLAPGDRLQVTLVLTALRRGDPPPEAAVPIARLRLVVRESGAFAPPSPKLGPTPGTGRQSDG